MSGLLIYSLGVCFLLLFALFTFFPILLMRDLIRNSVLSTRARNLWLVCGVLFFPFATYVYGALYAISPAKRFLSIASPFLCLGIAWLLFLILYSDTGEVDRAGRVEAFQEEAEALPDTPESEALRTELAITGKYANARYMLGGLAANADETMKAEIQVRDGYETLCLNKLFVSLTDQTLTSEEYAQWHRCWKTTLPALWEADAPH